MRLEMNLSKWWGNNGWKLLKIQLENRKDILRCLHTLSGRRIGKCTSQSLDKNGNWFRFQGNTTGTLFQSHAFSSSQFFCGSQLSNNAVLTIAEKNFSAGITGFEDKLFDYLSEKDELVRIGRFKQALFESGLRENDPRLKECMDKLGRVQSSYGEETPVVHGGYIDRQTFKEAISENITLIAKAFQNQLIIPEFRDFCREMDTLYWNSRNNIAGHVATYIPQLARYSPNYYGVSVCTVDGQRYSSGDVNLPFCLQSVSKPLTYGLVLDELTPEVVHQYVGYEPSGTTFNEISLNRRRKPHNPLVNSGAIVLCSLLKQELNLADRFDYTSQLFKRMAGGEYLSFNNSVFLSERETADRNFALGYFLRENKCFSEGTNLMETMDFYFQLCSVEVTCESGAIIAATLANGGISPLTGDKVISARAVRDVLSVMLSCGMYDYSGEFAFRVGLPAKSGVSGAIMLVVPNVMGIFLWSPPLDHWGNSVRGVQICQDLVKTFNFHHYDSLRHTPKKTNPSRRRDESVTLDIVNLLYSAYYGDVTALRRHALRGVPMDIANYDRRTALHIGAAEGHYSVVEFLLNKCKINPTCVDRWGFTPLDDAEKFGHEEVAALLRSYMVEERGDLAT